MSVNSIKHIAFIMDGNQRWAKLNNVSVSIGYKEGLENIFKIADFCINFEIPIMSVYALSTENLNRKSINLIFNLIENEYEFFLKKITENNEIKIKIIGEKDNLDKNLIKKLENIEKKTEKNSKLLLNIAFNYGSEKEIQNIISNIIQNIKINENKITENYIRNFYYLKNLPEPDILIRTGGFQRLSNFLLLYLKYTELFFVQTLWPDFKENELKDIIDNFLKLERKYGK